MKLRRQPEDFEVEELTGVRPGGGPFALYRLSKRGIGTIEAVDHLLRAWDLARARVAYGGLKDRHAATSQHLTIHSGPKRNLDEPSFSLIYLGQTSAAFTAKDIAANRFAITLRDLTAARLAEMQPALAGLARDGVANYFDDQRFGSLGFAGEFIAAFWMRGDYERALWLALADPNEHDDGEEREQKRILRERWPDWATAKAELARSNRRSMVTYLVDHPTDFRGAFGRLRVDLRSLWLAAYQSALWNRWAARLIEREVGRERRTVTELKSGPVWFWSELADDERARLADRSLQLPSARMRPAPPEEQRVLEELLAGEKLELKQLRVKHFKDCFFARADRSLTLRAQELSHSASPDDLYPGRKKLRLAFVLSRGAYATMVVKRVTS